MKIDIFPHILPVKYMKALKKIGGDAVYNMQVNEAIRTIIGELGKGNDTQRMMAEMWLQANTLRIKRIRPYTTAAGKLLTLHLNKDKNKK